MHGESFMADRLETLDSLRDRITARYDDLRPHLQRPQHHQADKNRSVAREEGTTCQHRKPPRDLP